LEGEKIERESKGSERKFYREREREEREVEKTRKRELLSEF
jgi:hypothetical protein